MVAEFNEKRISLFQFSFSCCQEFSHLSPIIVSQFQNNNVFFNNRLVIRCTYGNYTTSTNHLSFRVFIFYIFKIHFSTKTTIRSYNRRKTQATTLKLWTFRDVWRMFSCIEIIQETSSPQANCLLFLFWQMVRW